VADKSCSPFRFDCACPDVANSAATAAHDTAEKNKRMILVTTSQELAQAD
jgi:hypothetical protein